MLLLLLHSAMGIEESWDTFFLDIICSDEGEEAIIEEEERRMPVRMKRLCFIVRPFVA